MRSTLCCLQTAILCVFVAPAVAQDFYGAGLTARTAAQAGIYSPSSDDAVDALALNPAGLTALGAPTVNISAIGLIARGSFSNSANSGSPMQNTRGVIPFGAFGTPLGHSRWSIGVALTPDLLSQANWKYKDAPGAAGVDYGQQSEKSSISAFRATGGVGYSVSPNFAVGASVGVLFNQNTLDAPYIFQSQPVLKGLKTLLDLHTAGFGWDTDWGFRAKLHHHVELGAAYRTRASITSTGRATGNLDALFNALGVVSDPRFAYLARVRVVLPQSALVSVNWHVTSRTRLSLQSDWIDWYRGFNELPVSLTGGNNAVVNSLLKSSSLNDAVPLDWKQQFAFRAGFQRSLGENASISGGYVHRNDPVPGSTLTPLTAAIIQNSLSTGVGYKYQRYRFDLSYGLGLTAHGQVGASALVSGEYSQSRVNIGTQAVTLSTSFHL